MRGKQVIGLAWLICPMLCLSVPASGPALEEPTLTSIPLQEFQEFAQAIEEIKSHYVHEIKDAELFQNAIRGMLENLDPHSAFLDSDEFQELKINTEGEFSGLGIEVSLDHAGLKVISPLEDSPAMKVGIKAGDLIVKLDNTPVEGLKLKDAVKKMRGTKGSSVLLTVLREPSTHPMLFKVHRAPIRIKSVKGELMAPSYGYVKLTQFQEETPKDLEHTLAQLEKNNGRPLKGLILDLRNNPGGILDSAIDVCDLFLDPTKLGYEGLVVFTQGRTPETQIKARAKGTDRLHGAPLVILINEGSASASEIVAGALQDQNRAILIGQKSFGKGSVQTVLPLGEKQAIKLTTALYYTPSGRSIQAEGILPDIDVEAGTLTATSTDKIPLGIHEQDLRGHLKNEGPAGKKVAKDTPSHVALNPQLQQRLRSDLQLKEAFNVVKALQLAKK